MPLDIGIGICLAIIGAKIFAVPVTTPLVVWGIGCALLPDIDVFAELIQRRGKLGGKELGVHRTLMHYPIIYILPAIVITMFAGPLWGSLFVGGILLHLLHDSVGMGWGICWLWPFRSDSYKFFSDMQGAMSSHLLAHWTPEELKTVAHQHGDPDWIKHYYFELNAIVVIELVGFVLSLLLLLYVTH